MEALVVPLVILTTALAIFVLGGGIEKCAKALGEGIGAGIARAAETNLEREKLVFERAKWEAERDKMTA